MRIIKSTWIFFSLLNHLYIFVIHIKIIENYYLSMSATVSIILTHVIGALPQFSAQLNKLKKMKSSFLIQSFILWTITEHNKISETSNIIIDLNFF